MKKIFFFFLVITYPLLAVPQFKSIAEGPAFDEPEDGFSKLLLMKKGSTAFIYISLKEGIEVRIYDSTHKQRITKHIDPHYSKSKKKNVDAIFEIRGDVVIFISEIDERSPVLYRLIIDGRTGVLKEDEKIAELKKLNMGQEYAMIYGRVPPPDFFIRKDPGSENYALAMLNSFESDRNKRIEIVFYGSDNKEISRAYYSSPDNKYKYMLYTDMVVLGDKKVSVVAYAFNTKSSGGKESELVMANLDAGSNSLTLDELDFSKDLIITGGITRFDPITGKVILLAMAKPSLKSKEFMCWLGLVDPFERKLLGAGLIYPEKINEKCKELFGKKHSYNGLPQNLFINRDGGFSIVYEEITDYAQSSGNSSAVYTYSDLGNIGVSVFNIEGKETNSYLLVKNHRIYDALLHAFYQSKRESSGQELRKGNQYKSFAYLAGSHENYILFNDIERNDKSSEKGKVTTISGVGECDGFFYGISGNEIMPKRQFVFGKPESRREHDLALFSISDYNEGQNIYTTLKLHKEGRDKQVQIVWLRPN